MKNLLKKAGSALALVLVAVPAFATGSFDTLTAAVSFTDVQAAVLTVAVALVGLALVLKGIRIIRRMVGGR